MLHVGKPILRPSRLPFLTLPSIDHFLFKNLFAKSNLPLPRNFLIDVEDAILFLIFKGLGLISL